MNKGDLVKEVAKVVNTKKEAKAAVDCVFSTITKALKKKDAVALVGFGTFKVNQRNARTGRIPDLMDGFEKGPPTAIYPLPVCDATGSGSRPRCRPHGNGSHSPLPRRERSTGPHAGHCDGGASRIASPGFRSSERAKKAGILPRSTDGNGL